MAIAMLFIEADPHLAGPHDLEWIILVWKQLLPEFAGVNIIVNICIKYHIAEKRGCLLESAWYNAFSFCLPLCSFHAPQRVLAILSINFFHLAHLIQLRQ
jgi:hypothetical protein